jgi:hypothetical protein
MAKLTPQGEEFMRGVRRKICERYIETHLVRRVEELGGECRKVVWVGRAGAPDRLVMLPVRPWADIDNRPLIAIGVAVGSLPRMQEPETIWVELKNPDTIKTFPADAHERRQHREHERMRAMGQRVVVIGTIEQVEELLR